MNLITNYTRLKYSIKLNFLKKAINKRGDAIMKCISKFLMLSFLLLSLGTLYGCGTVNGFGHDVSSAGHGISRAAS